MICFHRQSPFTFLMGDKIRLWCPYSNTFEGQNKYCVENGHGIAMQRIKCYADLTSRFLQTLKQVRRSKVELQLLFLFTQNFE